MRSTVSARRVDRLVPGDADDALAEGLEEGLALGVVLAGEAVVVPGGAVGLDDEAPAGPAEVGDDAFVIDREQDVDVGVLEAGVEEEVEHRVLELAPGGRWARGEDPGEVGGASPRSETVEGLEDRLDADERPLRLADGSPQGLVVEA